MSDVLVPPRTRVFVRVSIPFWRVVSNLPKSPVLVLLGALLAAAIVVPSSDAANNTNPSPTSLGFGCGGFGCACPREDPNAFVAVATGSRYRAVAENASVTGSFATGQNADILVSGIDFNNSGGSLLFNHPGHIVSDGTRLFMTDIFNNRVLIWNRGPSGNTPPDIVLGQPDFTSNDPGTGRNQMNWPMSVSLGGGKLFVSDANNNRVLIWNSIPTANATPADVVVYAPWAWGVWSDGTRMVVGATGATSATGGAQVWVWNTVPTVDDTPQNYALNTTNGMGGPRHVSSDGTWVMVGDHNPTPSINAPGGGTFVWSAFPTSSATPYSFFLDDPFGFSWLKSISINGAVWGYGSSVYKWNQMPTARGTVPDLVLTDYYFSPGDYGGIAYINPRLYVASGNSNKILVYNTLPTSSTAVPDFAIGSPSICTNTLKENFFIQNGVPRSNGTNLFVSSDFDRKLYVWRHLPDQSNPHPDLYYWLPFSAWASALRGNTYVLAGEKTVAIWDTLPLNGNLPDRVLKDTIGNVTLGSIRGVAMDDKYFYLADGDNNKIYVWDGVPQSNSNPLFSISVDQPQRMNTDGTYLVVANTLHGDVDGPRPRVLVYTIAGLNAASVPQTVGGVFFDNEGTHLKFNLPQDAYVGHGKLFVADTGLNRVLGWNSISEALAGGVPDIVLGATTRQEVTAEIGKDKSFGPGSVWYDGKFLWVGEFKFSTRLMRYSPPCSYHLLSSVSETFGSAGGTGSVTVTPNATCSWTARSNDGFITVTSGASGNTAGTIQYSVAANTGATRSGTITIGNRTFTVNQIAPRRRAAKP